MSHTLIPRPPEVDVRRAVHVKILPDTHAEFKILCMKNGISMQEFIEEVAQLAIASDPRMVGIIRDLVRRKRERYFNQLSVTDAESLFDIIEAESPIK